MKLTSPILQDNQPIPEHFAFCAPDPKQHATFAANKNPPLEWGGMPDETQSLVLTSTSRSIQAILPSLHAITRRLKRSPSAIPCPSHSL
jgi:hypothetical protein